MALQTIEIQLGAETSIKVDGEDITSRVAFVTLGQEIGRELPIVQIGLKGKVDVSGKSIVEMLEPGTPSSMALSFLDSVDPQKVYDKAMEDEDLDGPGGVTGAIIRALKEQAREWI